MKLSPRLLTMLPVLALMAACSSSDTDSTPVAPGGNTGGGNTGGGDTGGNTGGNTGGTGEPPVEYSTTVLGDAEFLNAIEAEKTSSLVAGLPGARGTLQGVLDASVLGSPQASALTASASYSGTIAGLSRYEEDDDRYGFAGDVRLNANFGSGAVTGTITDLVGYDEYDDDGLSTVASDLRVNGTISDASMTAAISGTITDVEQDIVSVYNATGSMFGDFRGAGAETVAGYAVIEDLDPSTNFIGTMEGAFVANKVAD